MLVFLRHLSFLLARVSFAIMASHTAGRLHKLPSPLRALCLFVRMAVHFCGLICCRSCSLHCGKQVFLESFLVTPLELDLQLQLPSGVFLAT